MPFVCGEFKVIAKVACMYSLKTYGGVELYVRLLLTLALDDVRDRLRAPAALSPAKEPQVHTEEKEGCMFLRAVWSLQKRFSFYPCQE